MGRVYYLWGGYIIYGEGILSMGRVHYLWGGYIIYGLFSAHTELHKDYVEVGIKSG